MWDLTVASDHDFYINVATTAVLVHNCPTEYPIKSVVRRCLAPVFRVIMTYLPGGNNYPSYPPIPTGTQTKWRTSATRRSLKVRWRAERGPGAEKMASVLRDLLLARAPACWMVNGYGGVSGYSRLLQPAGWVCQGPVGPGRPDG
jgi:hypothetical protein